MSFVTTARLPTNACVVSNVARSYYCPPHSGTSHDFVTHRCPHTQHVENERLFHETDMDWSPMGWDLNREGELQSCIYDTQDYDNYDCSDFVAFSGEHSNGTKRQGTVDVLASCCGTTTGEMLRHKHSREYWSCTSMHAGRWTKIGGPKRCSEASVAAYRRSTSRLRRP